MNCSQCVNWSQGKSKSRRVTMKTKCLSLSRIQKFKIKLGHWELPNVKVHTNSDIIKQIFTFCEKVFPRHKYNYPNSMKLCRRKKNTSCCLNHVNKIVLYIIIALSISLDIQNRISQGYFRGTWTLK